MNELSKLEWSILDSVSADWEAVALIVGIIEDDFPQITQREVAETVYDMYRRGLLSEERDKDVKFQTLIEEPEDYVDASYWFGLSEKGVDFWEKYAQKYYGEPVDWSQTWTADKNYQKQEGWIEGTSEEACLTGLERIDNDDIWQIDRATMVHSSIDGFKAKYYKYIHGGHRIMFKLKKR